MNGYDGISRISVEPLTLTLCLEEDSILLNQAVLDTLQHPRQVQMLINEERQMLLVQACTIDDREAIVVPTTPMSQFEMSGHWMDARPWVVYGTYIESHNAIVFDLNSAQPALLHAPLGGEGSRTGRGG